MNVLDRILPTNQLKRKWVTVLLVNVISILLTLWGIYGTRTYGSALFIITPFFMGFGSTVLYGYKTKITRSQAWQIGLLTLGIFSIGLIVFAIEGLICIAMAAPFGILLTWLGSMIGYAMTGIPTSNGTATLLILIFAIPTTAFMERKDSPDLISVVTSIEIDAQPETVWNNVVEFPELNAPTELLFKTGISYPINAKIEGTGVGAIRHCNFTTGSFVEPITAWKKPKLLKFKVVEQPAPMKEISYWAIDAPHLHDYFVSKQGQFKLTALPNGKTRLEGTTWYYHNIKPAFYWRLWSNYIIHQIHLRVLKHIKKTAES